MPVNELVDLWIAIAKNHSDARNMMQKLGYGSDDRLSVKLIARNIPAYRRVMLPPPEGVWGMPPEVLRTLPSYDPDVAPISP